jgi:anti-sigma regulatory factor (Ser/Thr protein kinase)
MEVTSGTIVAVTAPTEVAEARRRGLDVAAGAGLDETERGRLALVITEAGTNLLKHAGGGEVFVGPAPAGATRGVQVIALDAGRGIASLSASLRDGYSTAGTAGTGLGAIQRAASSFDVFSSPMHGTVIAATVYGDGGTPPQTGGVSVPYPGERLCGDGWATWSAGALTSIFVCDGLGHGADAAAATELAIGAFRRHAERRAGEVIQYVSDALRHSRGGAVALAELDQREGRARYCGIGNISGVIIRPDGAAQHLISHNGIAGHTVRRIQEYAYEWPAGSLIVLHSDGVGTSWSLARYPGLAACRPDVIAGVLYRDFRRGRDDVTVVVARNGTAA